jgi:hypothetical protein
MKLLLSLLSVFVSATPLASAQMGSNLAEVAVTNGFTSLVAAATATGQAAALVDPGAELSKF